jgi:hypothetical protein
MCKIPVQQSGLFKTTTRCVIHPLDMSTGQTELYRQQNTNIIHTILQPLQQLIWCCNSHGAFILNFYILNKKNISFQHIMWFRKGYIELLSTVDLSIYSKCWCLTKIIQINFKLELYSVQSWPACISLYHPTACTALQCIPFHFYLHMHFLNISWPPDMPVSDVTIFCRHSE